MEFLFKIYVTRADGTANRRFHKIRYTAALRFGVVLPIDRRQIELTFNGQPASDLTAHGENFAYEGLLCLNGQTFSDVVLIAKQRDAGKVDLITFWPRSQHADAHQSYTDPLVDTAMDGTPFAIDVVATRMHAAFRDNAGASPATLMKIIYEEESDALRQQGQRLADLLENSLARENQAILALDEERAARAEAESRLLQLTRDAYIAPPTGAAIDSSGQATLMLATEGRRGKSNQRAVLLHMSDGTVRANNWERGFDARLAYAKQLEGKSIRTDVWGGYSWRDWFKNIYPA